MSAYEEDDPYMVSQFIDNGMSAVTAGWSTENLTDYSMAMGLNPSNATNNMYSPTTRSSGRNDGAQSIGQCTRRREKSTSKRIPIQNEPTVTRKQHQDLIHHSALISAPPTAASSSPMTAMTLTSSLESSEASQTLQSVQALLKTMVDERREKQLSTVLATHREASITGMSQLVSGMKSQMDSVVSGAAASSASTAEVLKTIRTQLWIVGSMIVLILVLLTIFVALRTQRLK